MLITEKKMEEEAVEPQVEQIVEQVEQAEVPHEEPAQEREEIKVPLSALQKERMKRKELELELQWTKQNMQKPAPQEEDNSQYEPATKADLQKMQTEAVRFAEENYWIKQNPEKYEHINNYLDNFLKQRPNLRSAISEAGNRYEEAYTLMAALTPKQQNQYKATVPKKEAPNAPTSVPKGAQLNDAVDVMQMSDSEFLAWKNQKRRR